MRRDARGDSRYVEAHGMRHHYLEYNGGGDPTIVILPGITSPAITWEFVAEELAGDGARVLVTDVRGRGLSDTPADGYDLKQYADDAAAIIRDAGAERPIVLGHSMGARIAAALAAQHPDLVGPMIVIDPPLTGPGRAEYPTPLDAFRQQLKQGYEGTTAEEVGRFYPRWPQRELEIRAEWLASCDENAVVKTWENFHTEDFFDVWPAVRAPILFMYGEESPVVTSEGLAEVMEKNPAAEIVGIPTAGHMIPWENLPDFLAAVRGFVSASARS